jgi:transposase-like protein
MPRREDEYQVEKREGRGTALCPFCGSPNVSYNQVFKSFRCNRCEKSFPSPSYGSGGGRPSLWRRLLGRQ